MKLGKRITALALSACMLLGVAFVPTQAQEAGNGSGHRGDAYNNGITTAKTPVAKEETGELWATKLGGDWDYAGPPMYANGSIYTYWKNKLYKLNRNTGEVEASAELDLDIVNHSFAQPFGYSYFPVTYGDGKIYVGLLGGKIEAFDANTLEKKWKYIDESAEENENMDVQSPITYKDGKIYVGFTTDAFVCISSDDKGELQWRETTDGSFSWNGAAVVGDYVIYANKNGNVISRDKKTGKFADKQEFSTNAINASSVTYDNGKIYFMTGNAALKVADFDVSSGKISNLKSIDCSAYGPGSKSTPVVYKGIVYVGVGKYGSGKVIAINPDEEKVLWGVDEPAWPESSILLSNAYEEEGYLYLYVTYNKFPGGINVVRVNADGSEPQSYELFNPTGSTYESYTSIVSI